MAISHDAFVSYSHASDRELAPALEHALEKLAKPLLKLRALDVFRDQSSLTASPGLWPGIVDHLSGSGWFVLMASVASSASVWCNKEVAWWLENRSVDRLLIVLTDGEIAWDRAANDFDWHTTTAISRSLAGRFPNEPLYVDMRWARGVETLSLAHPRFRDVVVDIAAPLRGMRKDELDGADVRQHKRNRRFVRAGVSVITIAAVVAIWQAIVANQQRREAERQRDEAVAGRLASDARDARTGKQLDLALLLATMSLRITPTPQAANLLLSTLAERQYPTAFLDAGNSVEALAATSDGHLLASGTANGTVTIWDVSTRLPVAGPYTSDAGPVHSLAFSPDNRLLAAARRDGTIGLWDVDRRTPIAEPLRGHHHEAMSLSFSPDGRLLASGGGDGALLLWDVAERRQVADLTATQRNGSFYEINSVAFSADGGLLAFTTPNDGIAVWDVARRKSTGEPFTSEELKNPTRIAFSPDGTMLAAGDTSRALIVWDLKERQPYSLKGHDSQIWDVRFSRDSKVLASAGSFDGKVILWNVEGDGSPLGPPLSVHGKGASSAAFLGDSASLATGGWDGKIILWRLALDPAIGHPIREPITWISSARFSPDGKRLALGNETRIVLWDLSRRQQSGAALETGGLVSQLAFSRDGATLFSQSGNGIVHRWDLTGRNTSDKISALGDTTYVTARAFSSDGKTIASGTSRGTVTLFDTDSRTVLGSPLTHDGLVSAVAFSADGRLVASATDKNTIVIWDVRTRTPVGQPLTGHTGKALSLFFSPDGTWLASGSTDGDVRVWDVAHQLQIGDPLPLGEVDVTSVTVSPDAKVLAAGTSVGGIVLFDIDSRIAIGPPLRGHSGFGIQHLAFNPADGSTLVSEGPDGTVVLWDVSRDSWLQQACEIANRNLTCLEWRQYLRGLPYTPACPNAPRPSC